MPRTSESVSAALARASPSAMPAMIASSYRMQPNVQSRP